MNIAVALGLQFAYHQMQFVTATLIARTAQTRILNYVVSLNYKQGGKTT